MDHIGCSGYYYSYWKNRFYPKGTQPRDWLHYYSTVFDTVELNGTFYRTPKLPDLQRYASVTEPGFRFSVKMSKYITHTLRMKDCKQQVESFVELVREGLGDKLSCFLFQLPASFTFSDDNLERIVDTVPHSPYSVVELRHASWWNPQVQDAFRQAGITFCNVDYPGLDSYLMQTSDIFYMRMHGKPELFKSPYSTLELAELKTQFPDVTERFVYFNNTYYEAGYQNALELKSMLHV